MSEAQPLVIEQYGYRWVLHADGLYYGPIYPGDDDELVRLERSGDLGYSSVRQGEYRYFLRHPEAPADGGNGEPSG